MHIRIKLLVTILLLYITTDTLVYGQETVWESGITDMSFEVIEGVFSEITTGQYPEQYDHEDIQLQTVILREEFAGALNLDHAIIFYMDVGVKLRGAEITTIGIEKGAADKVRIMNNGIDNVYMSASGRWTIDDQSVKGLNLTHADTEPIEVLLTLWVSVSLEYEGEIKITVSNGETNNSVLAGKALTPITIITDRNINYWRLGQPMEKVVIQENSAGIIPVTKTGSKNLPDFHQYLIVGLEIDFCNFDSATITVTEGDIEVGEMLFVLLNPETKVFQESIAIEILKESTVPSTIEITDMKISPDRTNSEGQYALLIGGSMAKNGKQFNESPYAVFDSSYVRFENYLYDYKSISEVQIEVTSGMSTIIIDNQEFELNTLPYIENGVLMVPAEDFIENLAYVCGRYSVGYNTEKQRIIISASKMICLYFESTDMEVNGLPVDFDAAPAIVDGVVYIPLKAIAISEDLPISWNAETMTAVIN